MLHIPYLNKQRIVPAALWRYQHSLFLSLLLLFTMVACGTQSRESLRQAIIGKWINAENYSIEFYADGTGFVPAVEGELPIPAMDFSYIVTDATHVSITMGEVKGMNVEIKIEGDKMTWLNQNANVTFEYTRSR